MEDNENMVCKSSISPAMNIIAVYPVLYSILLFDGGKREKDRERERGGGEDRERGGRERGRQGERRQK